MDNQAALQLLRTFASVLELNRTQFEHYAENYYRAEPWLETNDRLLADLQPVRRIAQEIEPHLVNRLIVDNAMGRWPWWQVREATVQLMGLLGREDELAQILGPTGPSIEAAMLHPWVWQPAAELWDDGHFRSALQAAGAHVEIQLQAKLDRHDVPGAELVSAFRLEPPAPGKPRLRLPGYAEGSMTYTSVHEGAHFFGRGCMLAIRNIANHELAEPPEQVALEKLASLSVLARWIDEAELKTV